MVATVRTRAYGSKAKFTSESNLLVPQRLLVPQPCEMSAVTMHLKRSAFSFYHKSFEDPVAFQRDLAIFREGVKIQTALASRVSRA